MSFYLFITSWLCSYLQEACQALRCFIAVVILSSTVTICPSGCYIPENINVGISICKITLYYITQNLTIKQKKINKKPYSYMTRNYNVFLTTIYLFSEKK